MLRCPAALRNRPALERARGSERQSERESHDLIKMTFIRVSKEKVPRLRAWLDALATRRQELAESYRRQHTQHERFFLVDGEGTPLLVIASESWDLQAGATEFLGSGLGIDVEFKTLIQEIGVIDPDVELLFDSGDLLPDDWIRLARAAPER